MLTEQEKRKIEAEESYRRMMRHAAQKPGKPSGLVSVFRGVLLTAAILAFLTGYMHSVNDGRSQLFGVGLGCVYAMLPAVLYGATYIKS